MSGIGFAIDIHYQIRFQTLTSALVNTGDALMTSYGCTSLVMLCLTLWSNFSLILSWRSRNVFLAFQNLADDPG